MEIFASHLYAEDLAGLRRRAILKKEKKMCTCFGMLAVCVWKYVNLDFGEWLFLLFISLRCCRRIKV